MRDIDILLIEDDPQDVELIKESFIHHTEDRFMLESADSVKTGLVKLKQKRYDAILMDLFLPDSQGSETFLLINRSAGDIPIIVLTGADDDQIALKTVRMGAQDYLGKEKLQDERFVVRVVLHAIERKQAQVHERQRADELQKAYFELERAQKRLAQSEKLAQAGALASGVAHEIRNPLAIIMMGLDCLSRHEKLWSNDEHAILGAMKEAIQRADHIIGGLQEFANPALTLERTDIVDLVYSALEETARHYTHKRITVVRELSDQLAQVNVDPKRMRQVWLSILMNAFQAIEFEGRINLRACLLDQEQASTLAWPHGVSAQSQVFVQVEIEDNGVGMVPAIQSRVWEPFFTTRPTGQGTGLGLSVAQAVVRQHQGLIELESHVGRGTVVRVVLPA